MSVKRYTKLPTNIIPFQPSLQPLWVCLTMGFSLFLIVALILTAVSVSQRKLKGCYFEVVLFFIRKWWRVSSNDAAMHVLRETIAHTDAKILHFGQGTFTLPKQISHSIWQEQICIQRTSHCSFWKLSPSSVGRSIWKLILQDQTNNPFASICNQVTKIELLLIPIKGPVPTILNVWDALAGYGRLLFPIGPITSHEFIHVSPSPYRNVSSFLWKRWSTSNYYHHWWNID